MYDRDYLLRIEGLSKDTDIPMFHRLTVNFKAREIREIFGRTLV